MGELVLVGRGAHQREGYVTLENLGEAEEHKFSGSNLHDHVIFSR